MMCSVLCVLCDHCTVCQSVYCLLCSLCCSKACLLKSAAMAALFKFKINILFYTLHVCLHPGFFLQTTSQEHTDSKNSWSIIWCKCSLLHNLLGICVSVSSFTHWLFLGKCKKPTRVSVKVFLANLMKLFWILAFPSTIPNTMLQIVHVFFYGNTTLVWLMESISDVCPKWAVWATTKTVYDLANSKDELQFDVLIKYARKHYLSTNWSSQICWKFWNYPLKSTLSVC